MEAERKGLIIFTAVFFVVGMVVYALGTLLLYGMTGAVYVMTGPVSGIITGIAVGLLLLMTIGCFRGSRWTKPVTASACLIMGAVVVNLVILHLAL